MSFNSKNINNWLIVAIAIVFCLLILVIITDNSGSQIIPEKDRSQHNREQHKLKQLQQKERQVPKKRRSSLDKTEELVAQSREANTKVGEVIPKTDTSKLQATTNTHKEELLDLQSIAMKLTETRDHTVAAKAFKLIIRNAHQIENDYDFLYCFPGELMNLQGVSEEEIKQALNHFVKKKCKNLYTSLQKARLLSGRAGHYDIAQECIMHPELLKDDPRELLSITGGDMTYLTQYMEYFHYNWESVQVADRFKLFYFKNKEQLLPHITEEIPITAEIQENWSMEERDTSYPPNIIEVIEAGDMDYAVSINHLVTLKSDELEYILSNTNNPRIQAAAKALLDPQFQHTQSNQEEKSPLKEQIELIKKYPQFLTMENFLSPASKREDQIAIKEAIKAELEKKESKEAARSALAEYLHNAHASLGIEDIKQLSYEYETQDLYFAIIKMRAEGESAILKETLMDYAATELLEIKDIHLASEILTEAITPYSPLYTKGLQNTYYTMLDNHIQENKNELLVNDILDNAYRLLTEEQYQKIRQEIARK